LQKEDFFVYSPAADDNPDSDMKADAARSPDTEPALPHRPPAKCLWCDAEHSRIVRHSGANVVGRVHICACASHDRELSLLEERIKAGGYFTEHAIESVRRRVESKDREERARRGVMVGHRVDSDRRGGIVPGLETLVLDEPRRDRVTVGESPWCADDVGKWLR
jgi:hypothetical protein